MYLCKRLENNINLQYMKTTYLLNAFSLQMVSLPCNVKFTEVFDLPEGFYFKYIKVEVC